MPTVPIRGQNAYIGFAKQSVQGTAVAPSTFPRWLDGSNIQFDLKTEEIWEGDGSRRLSAIIKNMQSVKVKLVVTPRAVEMGFLETAMMGSGSDSFAAPTVATTLAALTTVGATQLSLTANTGLTGVGTSFIVIEPGTATEEIVPITTPGTGAGPYVYQIPATYNFGNGMVKAHANLGPVKTSGAHTITDQTDGNYYTIEVGLGALGGAGGVVLRVRDCKADTCKISSSAGSYLKYEMEFTGLVTVTNSAATVTVENHNIFLYTQGVWTLDGSAAGDALTVEQFSIERKNNLDVVQTEQVTAAASIFGKLEAKFTCDIVYQSSTTYPQKVHFGGGSGTTDAQTIWVGSLTLVFTAADNFNVATYTIPTLVYTKAQLPEPKADGKHFKMALEATATSAQGTNTSLMTTLVNNSAFVAY